MKVTVQSNLALLPMKISTGGALAVLSNAVVRTSDPFVPYHTGNLARSVTVGEGEIRYTAPYAAECYYATRPFNQKKHPRATAHWFEAAKAVSLGEWCAAVVSAIAKGGSK